LQRNYVKPLSTQTQKASQDADNNLNDVIMYNDTNLPDFKPTSLYQCEDFDTPVKKEDFSSSKFFYSTADSFNHHNQFSLADAISAQTLNSQ